MTNETTARFRAWWEAIRARLRRPGWIVAFLVSALLFVLKAFAEDTTVRFVRAVGSFLGGFFSGLIHGPVGITGLVFLALLGLLVVRAYWETRASTASMDSLMARHFKVSKEIAERQDAIIKEQEKALADCQAQSRRFFQQLVYGDQLIEPAPLDAPNFAVMFSSVEQMMPNALATVKDADRVWQHFVSQIASVGKDSAIPWLVEPINDRAIAPTRRAYKLLQDLVATKKDPRPGLAALYPRYCDWRIWILRFADLLHQNLYTASGSVDWHKDDTQFFHDLQQRFSTSHFTDVKNVAQKYNEAYGDQLPLPGPP